MALHKAVNIQDFSKEKYDILVDIYIHLQFQTLIPVDIIRIFLRKPYRIMT